MELVGGPRDGDRVEVPDPPPKEITINAARVPHTKHKDPDWRNHPPPHRTGVYELAFDWDAGENDYTHFYLWVGEL